MRHRERLDVPAPRLTIKQCFGPMTAKVFWGRGIDPLSVAPAVGIHRLETGFMCRNALGKQTGDGICSCTLTRWAGNKRGTVCELRVKIIVSVVTCATYYVNRHCRTPRLSLSIITAPNKVVQTEFASPQPKELGCHQIGLEQHNAFPILHQLKQIPFS